MVNEEITRRTNFRESVVCRWFSSSKITECVYRTARELDTNISDLTLGFPALRLAYTYKRTLNTAVTTDDFIGVAIHLFSYTLSIPACLPNLKFARILLGMMKYPTELE